MDQPETASEILEKIANTTHLQTAIARLERRKELQEADLKEQFHSLLEELKPKNILKNTIAEVRESTPLRNNLLQLAVGLGAGYFSKKLLVNKSAGVVKKALGTALQYGITHFIASKPEDENNGAPKGFFKKLFRRIKRTAV